MEGWPEKVELFPRLTKVGKAIGRLFCMHQLSGVSDHKFEHPLDAPLQPVVDWPMESDGTWAEPR